ncbi:M48 family metalloprotease [Streptomyces sp. NPDC006984]|uniref:M48 family metalloprotease n=1 Tax=Streptomyces sp. NPDC006984 TaxID=3155463 RepID=UPI0033CB6BA8
MHSLGAIDGLTAADVCGADPRVVDLWVPVGAIVVFWLLVFTVYWLLPPWRIRRRRYVPLGDELPDLARDVEILRRRARTEPVSWLAQPLDPRVSALAFGRWRRRHIVLSGGLLALRVGQPATFESVVLHELAHLRNRDVDISFLTIAAGRVGLPALLVSVPEGITWPLLWGSSTSGLVGGFANSFQALGLLIVVPLSRRSVLRSREFYADARAQEWSTSPGALRALFGPRDTRRPLTGTILRVHPSAQQRRAMLDDVSPLFRSGFWELCAVGYVLGALHANMVNTFVLNAALGDGAGFVKDRLAAALTGVLAGAVVGFLALRANEGFSPRARPRALRAPAWGLGCGLALGGGVFSASTAFALASTGQRGAGFLPWAGLLVLSAFLSARWFSGTAHVWQHPAPDRRWPAVVLCLLAVAVGLLFACVTLWLMKLMTAEALMSQLMSPDTPEFVAFVLGAAIHALVSAPYLVCAAALAALPPLLGKSLNDDTYAGARLEMRRTVGQGVRWGLWLMAGVTLLGFAGFVALGLIPVSLALLVLAIRTGRRPRGSGLAFAHAVLATSLAGVITFGGSCAVLSLTAPWSGQAAGPDLSATVLHCSLSILLPLVISACVPTVRKGRAPRPARTSWGSVQH